ncbi:MAG: ABC transporter permease [Lachnospiraceae bacterium]|jgi:putative ABC transport system permease protein|nr:ABC transporter permease [Lachnospiraceae bacterium]
MFFENIKLAVSSLFANKLRTFLTMLGIIIGITSVIAIKTVGNAMTDSVQEQMSAFGVNNVSISMYPDFNNTEVSNMDYDSIPKEQFTQEMLQDMLKTYSSQITALSVEQFLSSSKVVPDPDVPEVYANIDIDGVNSGYFTAENITMIDGKIFDKNAFENGSFQAIVSDFFVNNLYGGDTKKALGKQVDVTVNDETTETYTIVGVYRYDVSKMGIGEGTATKDVSTNFFVPYKNAVDQQPERQKLGITNFTLVTSAGTDTMAFADDVKQFLTDRLQENTLYTVDAFSMQSMVEESKKTMDSLTLAITAIAAIALLVGGIGVMNIMTVSITERTREIGTRKALGAQNSAIRGQFITEAVILCLVGGLFGMIDGIIVGYVACHFMGYVAKVPLSSVLIAFGFSTAIGVFFGYYPASKAARMDPIEALRYE